MNFAHVVYPTMNAFFSKKLQNRDLISESNQKHLQHIYTKPQKFEINHAIRS